MIPLRMPWSLQFFCRNIRHMSFASAYHYTKMERTRILKKSISSNLLNLRLKSPITGDVWLRHGTSDVRTFEDVVIARIYQPVIEAIPRCQYIVDLGGNIGLASRFFAAANIGCNILAVEPDESNLQLYKMNMSCIHSDQWNAIHAAVWHTNAPVVLGSPPDGLDFDSIQVRSEVAEHDRTTICGLTPATIFEKSGFPRIDLIKVDIEGAEVEMFKGDNKWLDNVRAIAIEFHGTSRVDSNFDNIVTKAGFKISNPNRHTTIAWK